MPAKKSPLKQRKERKGNSTDSADLESKEDSDDPEGEENALPNSGFHNRLPEVDNKHFVRNLVLGCAIVVTVGVLVLLIFWGEISVHFMMEGASDTMPLKSMISNVIIALIPFYPLIRSRFHKSVPAKAQRAMKIFDNLRYVTSMSESIFWMLGKCQIVLVMVASLVFCFNPSETQNVLLISLISKVVSCWLIQRIGGESAVSGIINRSVKARAGSDFSPFSTLLLIMDIAPLTILTMASSCNSCLLMDKDLEKCSKENSLCALSSSPEVSAMMITAFFVLLTFVTPVTDTLNTVRSITVSAARGQYITVSIEIEGSGMTDGQAQLHRDAKKHIGYESVTGQSIRQKMINGEYSSFEVGIIYAMTLKRTSQKNKKEAKDAETDLKSSCSRIRGLKNTTQHVNNVCGALVEFAIWDLVFNSRIGPPLLQLPWREDIHEMLFQIVADEFFRGKRSRNTIEKNIIQNPIKELSQSVAELITTQLGGCFRKGLSASRSPFLSDGLMKRFVSISSLGGVDKIISSAGISQMNVTPHEVKTKHIVVTGLFAIRDVELRPLIKIHNSEAVRSQGDEPGSWPERWNASNKTAGEVNSFSELQVPGMASAEQIATMFPSASLSQSSPIVTASSSTAVKEGSYYAMATKNQIEMLIKSSGIEWDANETKDIDTIQGRSSSDLIDITSLLLAKGILTSSN